jgi:hypothetical protein
MSLDVDGFYQEIQGSHATITITEQHPLIKLANALPWNDFLVIILPDLLRTEKLLWWIGRLLHCVFI